MIETVLIDARNKHLIPTIRGEIMAADFTGVDCETHDDHRHQGLMDYCGYDPKTRKKSSNRPLVFDMKRTVMTGFSLYPEGNERAYYFNLNHADVEHRLAWQEVADLFTTDTTWIAHNLNYELTVFASCYGIDLLPAIDTLQMAVSAYGPDEYDPEAFKADRRAGGISKLMPQLIRLACRNNAFDVEKQQILDPELADLAYKIIAKESDAAHSYNGFVKSLAYGYGLKQAVQTFFGHKMTTFEEVLRGRAHMGELTGEEVSAYGAEDAYWAVRLFRHLLAYMAQHCPQTIQTFFDQENPMVPIYSQIWQNGMRVNLEAIVSRRDSEREEFAKVLRRMRTVVRQLLPFAPEPHQGLLKLDPWYVKGHTKYRAQIAAWAALPDALDAYTEAGRVRGPVTNAWRTERGEAESTGPNFSHYMPIRVLLYDLLREKPFIQEGKTQSDGNARGKLKDRLGSGLGVELIDCLNAIAGIEQRMKLYLTPYTQLTDPNTGRLYPVVSSMLATRRMAASYPNPMQLAKRGESTYVRGFFLGDSPDHLVFSIDWSAIELVLIGEFAADPEFIKAFGQRPHEDLHSGAAADILSVDVPGLTEAMFKDLKKGIVPEVENAHRLFVNLKGQPLTLDGDTSAYKYWRTEVGKGANFNYWYSGFLSTIGERMGWSMDKTMVATERYRTRFQVAEQWRLNRITEGQNNGFITLADGHRRVRFEATTSWLMHFTRKFDYGDQPDLQPYNSLVHWVARKIQKRAFNQLVNADIQGSCATITKRSLIRVHEELRARGWDHRIVRFMIPIHDELVFSVHRDYVVPFMHLIYQVMTNHPDIFKHCVLDASPAIGLTFEPWDKVKAPYGQIELFEAPKNLEVVPDRLAGKRLDDDHIRAVVDYLTSEKKRMAA